MATQITIAGKEVEIIYASALPSGYGHKKITVDLIHEGNRKSFHATTNHMPGYDAANNLEGEEKYIAFYELIDSKIEDEVAEWLEDICKYYVIAIYYGDSCEYWNGSSIADDFSSKLIENAEGFKTPEEAQEALESVVKPYAESKGWKVSLSVEETF